VDAVVEAAGGHPLLLVELCRPTLAGAPGTLAGAVRGRLATLPPDQRHLFALVAAAGAPLGTPSLRHAPVASPLEAVSSLLAERLLRLEVGPRGMELLPTHDSFAEACLADLGAADRAALHATVAELLEVADDPRHELVASHLTLAGKPRAAALRHLEAARAAVAAYAYERANASFEAVFSLDASVGDTASRVAHAEVLAALGFGPRAAEAFLRAAGGETGDLALRLRAAEQYLLSSRVPMGRRLLAGVLQALGVAEPRGKVALLAAIAWAHLRLALGWLPGAPTPVLARALWVAAAALAAFEPVLAHWYGALYALRARASGESMARSRAAALEAILLARFRGTWFGGGAPGSAAEAMRLARASGVPEELAYAHVAVAAVSWSVCEAAPSIAASEEALRLYDGIVSPTAHWEANVARLWLFAMYTLTEQDDRLLALADHVEQDAATRDDTWALDAGLFWAVSRAHLLRGRPERARACVQAVLARAAQGVPTVGEVLTDLATADIALRAGDIAAAWSAVVAGLPRRARHGAENIPVIGVDYYFRRTALAAAVLAGAVAVSPAERKAATAFLAADRRRIRRLGGAAYGGAVAELAVLHAEALAGAGPWFAERAASVGASLAAQGKTFWGHLAATLPAAARGEREVAWRDGFYVDLYLPGLLRAG
jgi:hypothetical protein